MNYCHILFAALLTVTGASLSVTAAAQDLMPPVTDTSTSVTVDDDGAVLTTTHPMMRLTPDKSEIVRLDRNAASVMVGNPAHLSVLLDSPRTLVLVPRGAGATSFTVLDGAGNVVMQRHVVVASPKKNYVRIRRSCANDTGRGRNDCQATSVYFCPDICHEVKTTQINERIAEPRVPKDTPSYSYDNGLDEEGMGEEFNEVNSLGMDELREFQDFMNLLLE